MARKITLKDNVTDETLYPQAIADSVFFDDGSTLTERNGNLFEDIKDACWSDTIVASDVEADTKVYVALNRTIGFGEKLALRAVSTVDTTLASNLSQATQSGTGTTVFNNVSVEAGKEYYARITAAEADYRYISVRSSVALESTDSITIDIVYLDAAVDSLVDTTTLLEEDAIIASDAVDTFTATLDAEEYTFYSQLPASFNKIGTRLLLKVLSDSDAVFSIYTSTGPGASSIVETIASVTVKANTPLYYRFTPSVAFTRLLFSPGSATLTVTVCNLDADTFGRINSWDDTVWNDGGYISDGTIREAVGYSYTNPVFLEAGDTIIGSNSRYGMPDQRCTIFDTDATGSYYIANSRLYQFTGNQYTGFIFIARKDGYVAFNKRNTDNFKISLHKRAFYKEIFDSIDLQNDGFVRKEVIPILRNMSANVPHASDEYEKPVTLLHFSDIHQSRLNLYSIRDFANKFGNYLSDVLCTGDMVAKKYADFDADLWGEEGIDSFLLTTGNHDIYDVEDQGDAGGTGYDDLSKRATRIETYNQYFAPVIENWGVTQPDNAEENGYNYYYKDYDTTAGADSYIVSKVRLIAIDCMDGGYKDETGTADSTSEAQKTWLAATLEDARTSGYPVVMAAHFPPMGSGMTGFNTPFHSYETGMDYSYSIISWAVDAVDAFINNGGEFVCWLGGHLHYDHVGVITAHPNQLLIAVATANVGAVWQDAVRDARFNSSDLFNVVSIDPHYKRISVYRFGAHWDKWMRHREAMVIDYANRTLLSTY